MKTALAIVKWFWWLGLAFIPSLIWLLERRFMEQIGCPSYGDCYAKGSEILLEWDLLNIGSALFILPVCAWYLVLVPLRTLLARL